jgi:predicted dehydrogenase
MADWPAYAILGLGRWGAKMLSILEAAGRRVTAIAHSRREASESERSYTERLASSLAESGAQIAWLCVPPGPHIELMIRAAMEARTHVVIEKPWLGLTAAAGIIVGVHFEYCLLDEVESWRERFHGVQGLRFGGRFNVSRIDRLGIPPLVNLGCHLLAIRRYAAPQSQISEISCAYEAADERRVWIETDSIDFTHNRQPIIQRFIRKFEAATEGANFPFGLEFAAGVAEDLATYPDPQKAASRRP